MKSVLFSCLVALFAVFDLAASSGNRIARNVAETQKAFKEKALGTLFEFDCIVTFYCHTSDGPFTVSDETGAMSFRNDSSINPSDLRNGDKVRIAGSIARLAPHGRWYNFIDCTNIQILAHGMLPKPRRISAREINRGNLQPNELIEVEGRVVDACVDDTHANWVTFMLTDAEEKFYLTIGKPQNEVIDFDKLIGARITAVGIYNTMNDSVRATIRGAICVNTLASINIVAKPPKGDPFDAPDLLNYDFQHSTTPVLTDKRCSSGHVLAAWNGNNILIRTDNARLVRCELSQPQTPSFGEYVRVAGYPATDMFTPFLVRSNWRAEEGPPPFKQETVDISVKDLQTSDFGGRQFSFQYYGQPVRLHGRIRGLPVTDSNGLLYLESDGEMVIVDVSSVPESISGIDMDYEIEVTGTCVMETEKMSLNGIFPRINGFRIVVRTKDDIRILGTPAWLTVGKLLTVIGALLITLVGFVIWNRALKIVINRRSRELFNEQVAHYGADLRVDERTRLAVELHDSLSQTLTGVSMEVETAKRFMEGSRPELQHHLEIVSKTLKACRNELRDCLWDLRNQSLEETDMNTAIYRTILPHIKDVKTNIRFNIPRKRFSDNTIHAILRIIRELTINAIKHGKATSIQIAGGIEADTLKFSVTNNGLPFDPKNAPGMAQGHFGIAGIRERLEKFSGSLTIISAPGNATKARIVMKIIHPINNAKPRT